MDQFRLRKAQSDLEVARVSGTLTPEAEADLRRKVKYWEAQVARLREESTSVYEKWPRPTHVKS